MKYINSIGLPVHNLLPESTIIKDNQAAYPQYTNQVPGCGFLIAKILAMFSLVTGAAMGVLIDALSTSEVTSG